MPELPEVETVRLQLLAHLSGKTIASIEVWHQKTIAFDKNFKRRLTGKTIDHIDRVGKLLIISFSDWPGWFVLAHLKMTGQFFFVAPGRGPVGGGHLVAAADRQHLPNKHTRVAFHFTDGSSLYFNDMRLFGYTKLADATTTAAARALFGPEPIAEDFDIEWFIGAVRKRKAPIKAVLLDQSFIAGLGNIYVDEALWRAGVRPTRRADRLTKKEAAAIAAASGAVMSESIKVGGTTFQHFLDTAGREGNFTDLLQVFDRTGLPCPRCKTPIKKIRAAGRGTHFCPRCQR